MPHRAASPSPSISDGEAVVGAPGARRRRRCPACARPRPRGRRRRAGPRPWPRIGRAGSASSSCRVDAQLVRAIGAWRRSSTAPRRPALARDDDLAPADAVRSRSRCGRRWRRARRRAPTPSARRRRSSRGGLRPPWPGREASARRSRPRAAAGRPPTCSARPRQDLAHRARLALGGALGAPTAARRRRRRRAAAPGTSGSPPGRARRARPTPSGADLDAGVLVDREVAERVRAGGRQRGEQQRDAASTGTSAARITAHLRAVERAARGGRVERVEARVAARARGAARARAAASSPAQAATAPRW